MAEDDLAQIAAIDRAAAYAELAVCNNIMAIVISNGNHENKLDRICDRIEAVRTRAKHTIEEVRAALTAGAQSRIADAYSNLDRCDCGAEPLHLHRSCCARIKALRELAAAARQGGDVEQAPAESPQSGGEAVTPNPSPSHIPLMNKDEAK